MAPITFAVQFSFPSGADPVATQDPQPSGSGSVPRVTPDDGSRYDRLQPRPIRIYLGDIDTFWVGPPDSRGQLNLRSVNGSRVAKVWYTDRAGIENAIVKDLNVGKVTAELDFDGMFERVDFSNARCSASGAVTPDTYALEIMMTLYRSGEIACRLRSMYAR
jgi:hypothetical protein